jgi:hypothetical protein
VRIDFSSLVKNYDMYISTRIQSMKVNPSVLLPPTAFMNPFGMVFALTVESYQASSCVSLLHELSSSFSSYP